MTGSVHHERFVRFMAPYPRLWPDIGARDDQRRLRSARRQLGLAPDDHHARRGAGDARKDG